MAAGRLPEPGTETGPCLEDCHHTDCARTRAMAASKCEHCDEPIGFDRRFYEVQFQPGQLVHATCEENRFPANRASRGV